MSPFMPHKCRAPRACPTCLTRTADQVARIRARIAHAWE